LKIAIWLGFFGTPKSIASALTERLINMESILISLMALTIFGFVVAYLAQRKITELESIMIYHRDHLQVQIEDVGDEVKALGQYLVRLDPNVLEFPESE